MKRYVIITAVMLCIIGIAACGMSFNSSPVTKKNNSNTVNVPSRAEKRAEAKTKAPKERIMLCMNSSKDSKIYYTGKAVVLIYHHISDKPFSGITITPERFESDMDMLKKNGFNVVSLRLITDAREGKAQLPPNAVAVTFDDGIESYYKYAYPILLKYKYPSVNFLITYRNETYTPSKEDFNPLSPAEVKEMYQSGYVDIQSHSHNSHDYVYIDSEMKKGGKLAYRIYDPKTKILESEEDYKKRVTDDLTQSRNIIYKYTGVYPDMLCFPFGHFNKNLIDISKEVGFKYFVTEIYGSNKETSKRDLIFRIRAGDKKLDSEKLMKSITDCGEGKKD